MALYRAEEAVAGAKEALVGFCGALAGAEKGLSRARNVVCPPERALAGSPKALSRAKKALAGAETRLGCGRYGGKQFLFALAGWVLHLPRPLRWREVFTFFSMASMTELVPEIPAPPCAGMTWYDLFASFDLADAYNLGFL